jgi:hypothetical protein
MLTTIGPEADYSRSFSEELKPFDRLGASRPPVMVEFLGSNSCFWVEI